MTATAGTNLNEAVFLSENAAESFHARDNIADFASDIGGKEIDGGAVVYYDNDWRPQSEPDGARYTLITQISETNDIATAVISISQGSKPIFDLTVVKNSSLERQLR
jgi:hypothetical protein